MNKFTIMMLGVAPLCCSDLCAYAYDQCVATVPVKAVKSITKVGSKSASYSHSSGSGCNCRGAGRAYREYDREDDDDAESYPGDAYYDTY